MIPISYACEFYIFTVLIGLDHTQLLPIIK